MQEHTNIINQTLIDGCEIPGVRLWACPTGIGYIGKIVKKFKRGGKSCITIENPRVVKYGLAKGGSDIIGFVTKKGVPIFTAIECKTKNDCVRPHQKKFLKMIKKNGGISGVVRGDDDLYDIINGVE